MKARKGKKGSYDRDSASIVASLKACANRKDLDRGRLIHADLLAEGVLLEKNMYVGCALLNMYAKCGEIERAQEVFDAIPARNVVAWTALISGYAQSGYGERALDCFAEMHHEGITPNEVTYLCALKACASLVLGGGGEEEEEEEEEEEGSRRGKEIHAEIAREGLLERSMLVGNALIDMYVKCGRIEDAREAFHELPRTDVVSWNALIAGFVRHGHGEEALEHFAEMREQGFIPDGVTFSCALKACGSVKSLDMGEEMHAEVVKEGLHLENELVANAIVDMYVKCGELGKARAVFDELLPFRNVASWNILIGGYAQCSHGEEALQCYARMQCEAFSPDAVTCICAVKACSSVEAYGRGKMVHAMIRIDGSKEEDLLLGNALVDMYGRRGDLSHTREAFGRLRRRDVGAWNALIASCIRNKHVDDAFEHFDQMQDEGLDPNVITLVCILKACASVKALCRGREIHRSVVASAPVLSEDLILGNALIDMYAKCGALGEAREVFDGLSSWDVVSSTTLISGYSQQGHPEEAIGCYDRMQNKSLFANAITFACVFDACGLAGALRKGKEVHARIVGFVREPGDVLLAGNALVDMYGKCGELARARNAFHRLPLRDVVSWTSIITGYAKIGADDTVLELFCAMIDEGVEPSVSTFTVVLCACSHSGHLEEARRTICCMMNAGCGAMPTLEHLTCMVDLFGRAGYFGEAIVAIRSMPTINYLPAWIALLGACQKWGNVELGRIAFEHAVELDRMDGSLYVCMRNIYGAALVEGAEKVDVVGVADEAASSDCRSVDSILCRE